VKVERRDFLFLRAGRPAVLSCEPLFMRFLDSQMNGTTAQLFENLAADLRKVTAVRLDAVLEAFRASGGKVA
jgi:hypothetical protein